MSVGVWFWIGYTVTFYERFPILRKIFLNLARFFTAAVTVLVIINFFKPIMFTVDETGTYTALTKKYAVLASQTVVLLFLLLHSVSIVFVRRTEKRQKAGAISLFVLVLAAFIVAQYMYYELPFYSIAYLLGSCILHIFVLDDEKELFKRETQEAAQKQIQSASENYENIIGILSQDYFDLFDVDINTDEYIEYGSRTNLDNNSSLTQGQNFFKTINSNVNKLVYEEDREKLIEALTPENVLSQIKEKGTFRHYYRLMIEGKPTYVELKATRVANNDNHIIIGVTNVDAQMKDRIFTENEKEDQKAYMRLNALSRNLLVFYVVNPETDEYTEFSAATDFETLGIAKKGNNFFEETYKNSLKIIYEEDREDFNYRFTKKNILEAIKLDNIFIIEYRLLIDGKPTYVRLKASEIEEDGKTLLVFGVEDVDIYIRREKQQANELSAARELATKDALTGVRNKYAFSQVKNQLSKKIDDQSISEFAIIIFDINGLKEINDTKGHQAGDELIRKACSRICTVFKHSQVFRIGGDEFAAICQGQDYENISSLLQKMNEANQNDDVQIAYGMTRYCLGDNIDDVIKSADELMYQHKAALKVQTDNNSKSDEAITASVYQFPENLKKAYESSPLSFVYYQNINATAVPVLASDGFCRNVGMPREAVINWLKTGMFERMHPDDVGAVSQISDDFLHQRAPYDVIFRCRLDYADKEDDSKERYVYIHGLGKWQTMPDGTQLAVITYSNLSVTQETTAQRLEEYLQLRRDNYYTDALTAIPNANYLQEFGSEKLEVFRLEGNTPNVVYIDIYSMQSYNNQYGFSEGDKLLRITAKALVRQFPQALVVREGEDHFILITDTESEKLGKQLYRVNRLIRKRVHGNSSGIRCGVYTADEEVSLAEAIDHAKMALKRIENDMNKEVEFYSKASNILYLQDRYIIENFDKALKNGSIKGFYHAIHRVESKKVAAFEFLSRWIDPERGVIPPSEFIPVLLKYHQLYKLDLYMFEQACKEVIIRHDNGLPLVPVSVNFSRQDFDHIDVVSQMNKLYDKYDIANYVDKSYFIVEITEQDIEAGKETFKEQLIKIKENNYGLWLDDFGSGYSAISSFAQYEFDLIKFDMELVKHLEDKDGVNRVLLEGLLGIAKKLGIHTLIEGAETEDQIDFIKNIGCELVQGYYYDKPTPLDSILQRVDATGVIKTCETPQEREDFNNKWFEKRQ
jgi:diguanylate cyclase (GGDEF)-like protein